MWNRTFEGECFSCVIIIFCSYDFILTHHKLNTRIVYTIFASFSINTGDSPPPSASLSDPFNLSSKARACIHWRRFSLFLYGHLIYHSIPPTYIYLYYKMYIHFMLLFFFVRQIRTDGQNQHRRKRRPEHGLFSAQSGPSFRNLWGGGQLLWKRRQVCRRGRQIDSMGWWAYRTATSSSSLWVRWQQMQTRRWAEKKFSFLISEINFCFCSWMNRTFDLVMVTQKSYLYCRYFAVHHRCDFECVCFAHLLLYSSPQTSTWSRTQRHAVEGQMGRHTDGSKMWYTWCWEAAFDRSTQYCGKTNKKTFKRILAGNVFLQTKRFYYRY